MIIVILSICLLGYDSLEGTSLVKRFPKSLDFMETLAGSRKPATQRRVISGGGGLLCWLFGAP